MEGPVRRPVGFCGIKLYPLGDFARPEFEDTISYVDTSTRSTTQARTYNNGERVPREGGSRVSRAESNPYSRDDRGGSDQYARSDSNPYVRSGQTDAERSRARADEALALQMQQESGFAPYGGGDSFVRSGASGNQYARTSNPPMYGGSPNPYERQGSRQMM